MPTLKIEQYNKWSSVLPEGWKFDAQRYVMWGEKEIFTDSPENKKGVFYRLTLDYHAERIGSGWNAKNTGKQIPTVTISRYTPTGSGYFCSVVQIMQEAAAEPESKKNYNILVKLAAALDTADYFKRAAEKDTGKAYKDFSDFCGIVTDAAENSDSAEQEAAEETETAEAAENTTEEENAAEAQENAEEVTADPMTEDAPMREESAETVTETAPEESAQEEAQEPEAAPDMFATLAAAYFSGKAVKSKPRKPEPIKEEPPAEPVEEAEEEPQQKEPEPYGYHETNNDIFTEAERKALSEGLNVWKSGDYSQNYCFFSAAYSEGVRLVYSSYAWKDSKQRLQPDKNPEYSGFLVGTDFYSDTAAIRAKFNNDINRFIIEHIASEEAAAQNVEENAESVHGYEQSQIKDSLSADYTREAQDLFYKREKPELVLYSGEDHDTAVLIDYILEPESMIEQTANEYMKYRAAGIYRAYIRYNRISAALSAIESDAENKCHVLRRISETVEDQKTVKILLSSGHTVKCEARGVKNITNYGTISDYYVLACDRQYLRQNQYRRYEDIDYTEIKQITHGGRVLYSA